MKRSVMERFAVLCAAWMVACGSLAEDASAPSSVGPKDLASSPIARLAKAIEDGDAKTVAAFVCYPLKRKSPLPTIRNEEEFIAYFPILFDEAFRQEMREGRFSRDWDEVGCRGVMYRNGAVWVDGTLDSGGKINCVNNQSAREKNLREALIEEERATLPAGFAGLCDPVFCFETDDREIAGRVDHEENGDFRVLLFDGPARRGGGIPRRDGDLIGFFQATRIYEGSGGNHVYLDRFGRYALDVSVVGLVEAPELQLYERPTWLGDFEECRPAHYANWRDLLAPPDTPAPAGTSAE